MLFVCHKDGQPLPDLDCSQWGGSHIHFAAREGGIQRSWRTYNLTPVSSTLSSAHRRANRCTIRGTDSCTHSCTNSTNRGADRFTDCPSDGTECLTVTYATTGDAVDPALLTVAGTQFTNDHYGVLDEDGLVTYAPEAYALIYPGNPQSVFQHRYVCNG